jgi:hypothetical protein
MSIAQIATMLEEQGYTVLEIELERGRYDVEMIDANGMRVEAYLDAVTGAVLPYGDDDDDRYERDDDDDRATGTTTDGGRLGQGAGPGLGSPDPDRPLGAGGGFRHRLPDAGRAAMAPHLRGLCHRGNGGAAHLWGFVGPRRARFADFVTGPGRVLGYLRDLLTGRAERHLGHSPAGGAMTVALLFALAVTALSGMATLAVEEGQGPLAGIVTSRACRHGPEER